MEKVKELDLDSTKFKKRQSMASSQQPFESKKTSKMMSDATSELNTVRRQQLLDSLKRVPDIPDSTVVSPKSDASFV